MSVEPHLDDQGDWVCPHGIAMDVHCCGCHSGFIFDLDHVCSEEDDDPSDDDLDDDSEEDDDEDLDDDDDPEDEGFLEDEI